MGVFYLFCVYERYHDEGGGGGKDDDSCLKKACNTLFFFFFGNVLEKERDLVPFHDDIYRCTKCN